MSSYATEHAGALADILAAGASATIVATTQAHTESTDAIGTPTEPSQTGAAMRVTGDPRAYAQLTLKEEEAATLLFAPTTYGDESALKLGAKITSAVCTGRIRSIAPIKPNGSLIMARLVVQVA